MEKLTTVKSYWYRRVKTSVLCATWQINFTPIFVKNFPQKNREATWGIRIAKERSSTVRYMGSKRRLSKYLLPILESYRKPGQAYVEPFVGGANMIDKLTGWRIGGDAHEYLIAFWQAFVLGWEPPKEFTKEQYYDVKANLDRDKVLSGYVGFTLSFSAKWWNGWARCNRGRNYVQNAYDNLMKQRPNITGVQFVHATYDTLPIPKNSLIYCDPPYANTTKYKVGFNHTDFWAWCTQKALEGHTVLVSEYSAPSIAKEIWAKEHISTVAKNDNAKPSVEKLFLVSE